MKKITTILFLILIMNVLSFAQGGISIGYSAKNQAIFDIYSINKDSVVFGLDLSFGGLNETTGKRYDNISWSKFPKDVVKEGTYNNSYNLLFGFTLKKLYETYGQKIMIVGKIGYIDNNNVFKI